MHVTQWVSITINQSTNESIIKF